MKLPGSSSLLWPQRRELGWPDFGSAMSHPGLWPTYLHPTPVGWGLPSCSQLLCECSVLISLAFLSSCPHPVALGPAEGEQRLGVGIFWTHLPPSPLPFLRSHLPLPPPASTVKGYDPGCGVCLSSSHHVFPIPPTS